MALYYKLRNLILTLAAFFLFSSIFLYFTKPITASDFWWHLNTGRWIIENGSLPQNDPFTYTASNTPDKRKDVILKGFWLSQATYYFLYSRTGFAGIIFFKAALFTLILFVFWRILSFRGLDPYTGLLVLSPVALFLSYYEEARPQVFSFFAVLIIFYLFEQGLKSMRDSEQRTMPISLLFLPLVMLLWANMHRGFIIGHAMIGIYLLTETFKFVFNKGGFNKKSYVAFVSISIISAAASFLNPSHVYPVFINLRELSSPLVISIDEYLSPWKYADRIGDQYLPYCLVSVATVTLSLLILSWKRLKTPHILLYLGFAAAAFKSFRFSPFFILISPVIAAGYLPAGIQLILKRARTVAVAAIIISAFLIMSHSHKKSFLTRESLQTQNLPIASADFILRHRLPGYIFNPYEWGGYLAWSLYPDYKVFTDSRMLDPDVHTNYSIVKHGRKDAIFDQYGINTVIFYPFHISNLNMPDIIFSLLKDDRWRLVYFDYNSVIFIRAVSLPAFPSIGKELLWDDLIASAESWVRNPPPSVNPRLMLWRLYSEKGDYKKAAECIELHYRKK